MPPIIDKKKCTACGLCANICNSHIFSHSPKQIPKVEFPDECWHCDSCVLDCPAQAISLRIPLAYTLMNIKADQLKP